MMGLADMTVRVTVVMMCQSIATPTVGTGSVGYEPTLLHGSHILENSPNHKRLLVLCVRRTQANAFHWWMSFSVAIDRKSDAIAV